MDGVGVLLERMFYSQEEADKAHALLTVAEGKVITNLDLRPSDSSYPEDHDCLEIRLEGTPGLRFTDEGQSCCEHRYMATDDDLSAFVGATFVSVELRDGPEVEADYEVKESQFLVITTSLGAFTIVNYNEHNGYYGGFSIRVQELQP